ncbi:hypothetical protein ACHAXM_004350 [Skeletonema potamos]
MFFPPLANFDSHHTMMKTNCRWLWLALAALHILPPSNGLHQRQTQASTTYDTIDGRSCYRSIEGMNQFMRDLAAKHPNLVTMETIGESYIKKNGGNNNNNGNLSPGYDIYALNITDANSVRQSSEKGKLLITSGIHAREYTPTELLGRFIELLVDGYNENDAQITSILQHNEIHTIVHVNPDGRYMAENSPDTYWRKNMNPTGGCKNDGLYGVDINRNFDFLWGDEVGSSSDSCSDEYHGSGTNSEPETQAVVNYANRIFPESQRRSDPEGQMNDPLGDDIMGMYLDIHSTGEFIYYPWGHRNDRSPDDDAFQAIARKMSYYNGYNLWASGYDFLYPVSGDSSDYMYAIMGVSSMGLELGFNFYEDCDTFETSILPSNLDVLLYSASIAGKPFSLAKGPDVLDVVVDYDVDGEIIVTAEVSDGVMVNSLDGEADHQTGAQVIVKVVLCVDVHPDDFRDGDLAWEMSPLDGAFDNSAEIVELSLSTSELSSGRHTLHVQATDSGGYRGPVKSLYIEVEKTVTNAPSKYPTSAPTTVFPTTTSPTTASPTTFRPTKTSPTPNLTPLLTTAEPSRNPTTTTSSSPNATPSQPPTVPTPTAFPNTTSSPTSVNLPTADQTRVPTITSLPSNTPTKSSSPSSINFPTATNVSLQSAKTDDSSTYSSSSFAIRLRLMMTTTFALTCWMQS